MLKVALLGMGPLGCSMAGYFAGRKSIALAGAADSDPAKIGRSAGELSGAGELNDIIVEGDISCLLERTKPDAVIIATVSSLSNLIPQVEQAAAFKADIVSTCEELAFPWHSQPEEARIIDDIAKKNGVTVLGTGVNPGFMMDYLPSVMTGICREIKSIRVSRIQDASPRRISFRKKIGTGLPLAEFDKLKKTGVLRHVGLVESIHMLAAGAGWALERTEETLEAVVGNSDACLCGENVPAGAALGVEQKASGFYGGREVISLIFRAAAGETSPRDIIEIEGTPSFKSIIPGGINGDIATCAVTVNAVKSAVDAPAGLKTMIDVPAVTFLP